MHIELISFVSLPDESSWVKQAGENTWKFSSIQVLSTFLAWRHYIMFIVVAFLVGIVFKQEIMIPNGFRETPQQKGLITEKCLPSEIKIMKVCLTLKTEM